MKQSWYEETKRVYNNGVTIIYENIDNDNLYIHSVTSTCVKQGNATSSLKDFLEEFKEKSIYIFSSSELGTSKEVLNKWYEKLGFITAKNVSYIPYNITHLKSKSRC